MKSADQIAEAVIALLLADPAVDVEVLDEDTPMDPHPVGDVWYPRLRVVELHRKLTGPSGAQYEEKVVAMLARIIVHGMPRAEGLAPIQGITQRWPGRRVQLWRNREGVFQHEPPSTSLRHQVIWTETAGGEPSYQHYWLSFQIAAVPGG